MNYNSSSQNKLQGSTATGMQRSVGKTGTGGIEDFGTRNNFNQTAGSLSNPASLKGKLMSLEVNFCQAKF